MTYSEQELRDTLEKRFQIVKEIVKDAFAFKHIEERAWLTPNENIDVYPITIWNDDIEVFWDSKKPCNKWIDHFVETHSDSLKYGYFNSNYTNVPACISFRLNDSLHLTGAVCQFYKDMLLNQTKEEADALIDKIVDSFRENGELDESDLEPDIEE